MNLQGGMILLPNFRAALDRHRDKVSYDRIWRYNNGRIPQILQWVVENVDLAEALAQDARALAEQAEETEKKAA